MMLKIKTLKFDMQTKATKQKRKTSPIEKEHFN